MKIGYAFVFNARKACLGLGVTIHSIKEKNDNTRTDAAEAVRFIHEDIFLVCGVSSNVLTDLHLECMNEFCNEGCGDFDSPPTRYAAEISAENSHD